MAFPIAAALSLTSSIGGLFGGGSGKKQRKAITKSINEQIKLAAEEYEVIKRVREIEANESLFQYRRENNAARNENRAAAAQLRVQTAASRLETTQKQLENTVLKAQAKQQAFLRRQQQQQERLAAAAQSGQINQQAAETTGQIQQGSTQATVSAAQRGQSTSRSTQAGLQRNSLLEEDVQANAAVSQGSLLEQAAQDTQLNDELTALELQLQQSGQEAQDGLLRLQDNLNTQTLDSNLEILRLQGKGVRQAGRMGRAAELARQALQTTSDKISYESKVTGLKAQMPQSSGTSFGSILGGLANVGSNVYGLVSELQPVNPTSQVLQTPLDDTNFAMVGTRPSSSLDSLFGISNQRTYTPPTAGLMAGRQKVYPTKTSLFNL